MVKFSVGDKVFAKVRGYPAWPARVEAVADATPNKVKYHVFFYGTLETAVCKSEDIYPYAENKENYGKPSKRRLFNEGLAQIEGRAPVPALPRRNNAQNEGDDEEEEEGTLVIDENPSAKYGKPIKRKRDSDATGDHGDEKLNVSLPSTSTSDVKNRRGSLPAQKRLKKDSTSSSGDAKGNDQSPTSKQEIVSRSGRKIKPKRFADEEAFNSASVSALPENAKEGSVTGATNFPLKGVNKKDAAANLLIRVKERRKKQLEFWKKELEMLKQEERLKIEFNIKKPNPEQGLTILNEFHHIGIEPLMLKKHPHVLETIKKLCKYVGNPVGWKYSKEQKKSFAAICEKVKQKAKVIIDEFAVMFNVTDISTFHDVFLESVAELKNKTNKWDQNKFLAMVEDPTAKQVENKKTDVKKTDAESRFSSDAENGLQEEE
ncbi:Putative oxidoreductase GLYR1 homolog [Gryllus bimaculatus]|nr:Putative oxidoreductase GLYR1 homolog [Gryllus bimaculatus]